jgi:sensor histidine kinase YesM
MDIAKKNIYSQRQRWKLIFFVVAIIIAALALYYSNKLAKSLAAEERKKLELWAEATRQLINTDINSNQDLSFIWKVIENNTTVPVILTDDENNIISYRNIDSAKISKTQYLTKILNKMKDENHFIEIDLGDGKKNIIYYGNSNLLIKLLYYPYIFLGIVALFIFISYLGFNSTRLAEQNQVWVGLAKETAHQLGTPISSLMAWTQIIKENYKDEKIIKELEQDIDRLAKITERFSKIGSVPILNSTNIVEVIVNSVEYMRARTHGNVKFEFNFNTKDEIFVPINITLFEWVLENVCKNAIDAMKGNGKIDISIYDHIHVLYLDIKDTGKGIPKSKFKTIFRPGYSSKPRGWGLGLTLSKRIIELYHKGKIFVNESDPDNGTTIRIVLRKNQ